MEPLQEVFDAYRLDELDNNWINQVWDSQFANMDNLPVDYSIFLQSPRMTDLLKKTCIIVKDWTLKNSQAESSTAGQRVSWETLLTMNLDVRALLAVLTYLMKKARDWQQSCLRATSVYFVLVGIPGSDTFQAFHPVVFEIALKTLNLSARLIPPSKKKSWTQQSNNESDTNENGEERMTLSKMETTSLTKGLNSVMYELVRLLVSANLRLDIHLLESTIGSLVELTKLANETINNFNNLENRYEASVNSLAYNAYVGLYAICHREYASIELITRLIGKYVLPLLCVGNAQLPAKQMTIIQESTIHFIETVVKQHGQLAQPALTTLIQHLMTASPDRSEERHKQANIVKKLINLCRTSDDAFAQSVRDLVLFSHHNKTCCRIFAQEIIGKFLLELSDTRRHEYEDNLVAWPARKTRKLLLATVLSKCVDPSRTVRGRAIATFAEYTESIKHPDVEEIFSFTRINSGKEMPSLDKLEEAIDNYEAGMEIALPDVGGIIEMLRERGNDEGAHVRKSALQALRNGVSVSEELFDQVKIMIQSHCRDATLTVGRFAIRVLTTLLEKFPDCSSLREDWVNHVLPRVFDSEGKIQEEVVDSLETLTIDRIVNGQNSDDDLPWSMLREIAANNMGYHLTRACDIWTKRKTITDDKINCIKRHIGTKNDIEAWLLLASISVSTSLPGMERYDKYYERALSDTEPAAAADFLAYSCLRVVRNSWPNFDDDSLKKIRANLWRRLNAYEIRVPLVGLCLDILYGITKRLENEPDIEISIMRDLMRLSEAKIVRIMETGEEENRRSESILFRAMCTMGHASSFCRDEISTVSLRTLERFVVERNSLPKGFKSMRQLEGAAITVLAQLALRDRDMAQKMTPIFGRLLRSDTRENSSSGNIASGPAVRINAANALADICTKFTSLVEPYLPDMCISMKDPNVEVRRVILVIFIQLLVEDFIKINGAFFFNILTMLADSDETIRKMTMFLIKERLVTKNKCLIAQRLVQSIFHFNDFKQSAIRSRITSRQNNAALTLSGQENSHKRRIIYDFMLQQLDSSGKLTVFVRLTRQIFRRSNTFGSVQPIDFNCEKGRCILRDAMYIASSDYFHSSLSGKQTNDEEEEDANRSSPTVANTAITEAAIKKHRILVFLPSLVELKRHLAKTTNSSSSSLLLRDVVALIDKTLADYNKDQLATFYDEYPKFEKELERDIRQYKSVAPTGTETCDKSIDNEEQGGCSGAASPKRPNALDKNSLLINPDRTPRIVLRRLSTLTYPGISGWQTTPAAQSTESFEIKISENPEKINLQKSLEASPCRSRGNLRRPRESTPKQHGHLSREQHSDGVAMESWRELINTEPGKKLSSRENSIGPDKSSLITSSSPVPRIRLKRLSSDDYPGILGPQMKIIPTCHRSKFAERE